MSDTVFVGYLDNGSEGASEPLRVFESQLLATIWQMGVADSYGTSAKVKELGVLRGMPAEQKAGNAG